MDSGEATAVAHRELEAAGYRTFRRGGPRSPYLPLPDRWEDLNAALSRNLRCRSGGGAVASSAPGR